MSACCGDFCLSESHQFPINELHFIQKGFKLSPSTYKKNEDCELMLYHHKIINSPPQPEPNIVPTMGRFNHRNNEIYFDRLDMDTFFSFQSARDIIKFLAKAIPENTPSNILPRIVPHIKGFAEYEFSRYQRLLALLGSDKSELWRYYIPLAREYIFDDSTIGIYFKADLLTMIPPRLYDNS